MSELHKIGKRNGVLFLLDENDKPYKGQLNLQLIQHLNETP